MPNDTVLLIPGTFRDDHRNVHFEGEQPEDGLRQRFKFVMGLKSDALSNVALHELPNWLRWGCRTGVMWEFQLEEMIMLITKWEQVNSRMSLYLPFPYTESSGWEKLWTERGFPVGISFGYRCDCGTIRFRRVGGFCSGCNRHWTEIDDIEVPFGPRGEGSYDLGLNGAGGEDVAIAAYYSRGKERKVIDIPHQIRATA